MNDRSDEIPDSPGEWPARNAYLRGPERWHAPVNVTADICRNFDSFDEPASRYDSVRVSTATLAAIAEERGGNYHDERLSTLMSDGCVDVLLGVPIIVDDELELGEAEWVAPKEIRTTSLTGGQKGSKAQKFSQIPTPSLMALAETYAYGASKYSRFNFRNGYDYSLSYDAMQRHAWAWNDNEDFDPESGLNHMAHVAWHALNLLQMQADPELEHLFDDRFKGRD